MEGSNRAVVMPRAMLSRDEVAGKHAGIRGGAFFVVNMLTHDPGRSESCESMALGERLWALCNRESKNKSRIFLTGLSCRATFLARVALTTYANSRIRGVQSVA